MPAAEFEEKEFEGPLSSQLTGGSPLFWPPGQVLEAVVGFDVALMATDAAFWASVGFDSVPSGLPILPLWWPDWPSLVDRTPPPFRFNAFLQYKRPYYLARGKERRHWRSAYFRFDLMPHQQRALEACAKSLGSLGYVAYSSPAFFRRADLFAFMEKQTLVANTHFVPAMRLTNHSRYTYISARSAGKGHSDPVTIHPEPFFDGPPDDRAPPGDGGGGDDRSPGAILSAAKKAAREGVEASPEIVGGREAFERAVERAQRLLGRAGVGEDQRGQPAVDNYLIASVFSRLSGVQWLVRS